MTKRAPLPPRYRIERNLVGGTGYGDELAVIDLLRYEARPVRRGRWRRRKTVELVKGWWLIRRFSFTSEREVEAFAWETEAAEAALASKP